MSRLKKYMVYNPNKDKPKVFYTSFLKALKAAKMVHEKEQEDVLVVQVVAKLEKGKADKIYKPESRYSTNDWINLWNKFFKFNV